MQFRLSATSKNSLLLLGALLAFVLIAFVVTTIISNGHGSDRPNGQVTPTLIQQNSHHIVPTMISQP